MKFSCNTVVQEAMPNRLFDAATRASAPSALLVLACRSTTPTLGRKTTAVDFKDLHLYVMQFNGPDRGAQVVSGAPYCAHCLTSVFRFAKGERVLFKGRSGRVAEGYASGKILQYEIEIADGERFMASEHEVQPQ